MPELPEVETVRLGLEKTMLGATIAKLITRRAGIRIPFPKNFAEKIKGQQLHAIKRRGKYLLFYFSNKMVMIAHLGMSGRFVLMPKLPKVYSKHDHVIFFLKDGRTLIFNDARRFGLLTLADEKDIAEHSLLRNIGPDPFDKAFSPAYFKKALGSRRSPIKVALMDQSLVAGVGNIYASEALFEIGRLPTHLACDTADKAALLIKAIQKVLKAAIASGGSSLRDFVKISGEAGYFQHHFNVYGRANKPCRKCGHAISEIRLGGRSTFFCPQCQQ